MKIKIKLETGAKAPEYKRTGDACLDCYAAQSVVIKKGERALIPLGFSMQLPKGYEAIIRPRSGLSSIGVDVAIGTIDSNYRGIVSACVINNANTDYNVFLGDRICQLAIRKTVFSSWKIVKALNKTVRGSNGFGSSGR